MLDALRLLTDPRLQRIVQSAPQAADLVRTLQRAVHGDQAAIDHLRRQGWSDALELVQPGAGSAARAAVDAARAVAGGNVVDGEWRELGAERAPWSGFVRRVVEATHGAHVVLGPVGSGKTSLALRLAQRWGVAHGYTVECVSMYGDDRPAWAVTIDMETLIDRMRRLRAYLRGQSVRDEEEAQDAELVEVPARLPPQRRAVVIDEAILSMSTRAGDRGRDAALQALAQCRHLAWHCVYIAQWAGQLPPALLGQTVAWVKQPAGREALTDRDNPVVRDLWERAGEAFAGIRQSAWFVPPYDDVRAWAFADAPALKFSGLVPVELPELNVASHKQEEV